MNKVFFDNHGWRKHRQGDDYKLRKIGQVSRTRLQALAEEDAFHVDNVEGGACPVYTDSRTSGVRHG